MEPRIASSCGCGISISWATFFALVVISSIALMVGGIGVMAIMSISVTERTREIGVARRSAPAAREMLFQFLIEAAFLTSVGGVLGIMLGSGIGVGAHLATGFPISLPWWSFAIGLGFSATVGICFGMYPAIKGRPDSIQSRRCVTNEGIERLRGLGMSIDQFGNLIVESSFIHSFLNSSRDLGSSEARLSARAVRLI